ncbi:MAG: hypothetical protein P9M04_01250 [Candidatus Orphnella occulta]|nr:hypothetical protein [Candidatus Orphnella occulta]
MKRYSGICCVVVLVIAVSIFCASGAFAQQEQVQQENKVVKFLKDIVKWPFSITKQAVGTVGRTTEQGLTTVTNTGVSVVETVTGKPEKIKDVVVIPVKGTVDTGYTAVEGSINTPIKGTQEAFE